MSAPSLIFYAIFVIPLIVFLVWLMRQDKRKGKLGIVILFAMLALGLAYMYWKTGGQ